MIALYLYYNYIDFLDFKYGTNSTNNIINIIINIIHAALLVLDGCFFIFSINTLFNLYKCLLDLIKSISTWIIFGTHATIHNFLQ